MFFGLNKIFSNIKGYYQGINGATLTGAIDVIVVEQSDGSYKSTPFHVRFGKIGILRPSEKTVDITVNGEIITELEMRLGSSGEAYFEVGSEGDVLLTNNSYETNRQTITTSSNSIITTNTIIGTPNIMKSHDNLFTLVNDDRDLSNTNKARFQRSSSLSETDHAEDKIIKILPVESCSSDVGLHDEVCNNTLRVISNSGGCKSDTELDAVVKKEAVVSALQDDLNWEWGQLPQVKRSSFSSEMLSSSLRVAVATANANNNNNINYNDDVVDLQEGRKPSSYSQCHNHDGHEGILLSELVDAVGKDPALTDLYLYSSSPNNKQSGTQENSDHGYRSDTDNHDKGIKTLPTVNSEPTDLLLSLCGGLNGKHEPSLDWFLKHRITYDDFMRDTAATLNHPDLIVRFEEKYYTWPAFCAMMVSFAAFQTPLPETELNRLNVNKNSSHLGTSSSNSASPRKSSSSTSSSTTTNRPSRSFFSFWGRSSNRYNEDNINPPEDEESQLSSSHPPQPPLAALAAAATTSTTTALNSQSQSFSNELSSCSLDWHSDGEVDKMRTRATFESPAPSLVLLEDKEENKPFVDNSPLRRDSFPGGSATTTTTNDLVNNLPTFGKKCKTIRLTSDHLKKLNLREGANEAIFSVTTKYQGTCRCACYIYLWKWTDRIVVSDIDGTITKSDVLGNIFSLVGPYWAQRDIATLYNSISLNDYRFMYLTARAIGQAAITRNYLRGISQDGLNLPDGPLLMSPSSLFHAFHVEVISRQPELFKISCLSDVRSLFPEDQLPLYAGFGNKPTDVVTYKSVGMDLHRIFTVNPQGQLRHELPGHKVVVSYSTLGSIVDMYFPPVQHLTGAEKYSQFAYWRDPVLALDEIPTANK